jgi:hypothetical protein
MGSTRNGSPLLWAMIEDATEKFYMASSGEGSSDLLVSRRRSTEAPPASIITTPWLKGILGIVTAQQAESFLQRRVEASVLSPCDTSSNQLSHIHNSIFFRINTYVLFYFQLVNLLFQRNNQLGAALIVLYSAAKLAGAIRVHQH